MNKMSFISVLLVSTAIFVSCSPTISKHPTFQTTSEETLSTQISTNAYGSYLAGRVAHIRKDFGNAADYYELAYSYNKDNPELLDKLYLLLTSQGRIDEAAYYADLAIKAKSNNNFAHMVCAINLMKKGNYEQSIDRIKQIKDPIYHSLIGPMINAWNYAGLNNPTKSFSELNKLNKETNFKSIYRIHYAMLLDFFGKNREAEEAYTAILSDKNSEISVRLLDIITNFYLRTNQKDKAVAMMNATINNQNLDTLLRSLHNNVLAADNNISPIISSASIGAGEALFTIASTFRYDDAIDVAHMYNALAIYVSPNYSTAKILMADILEAREMIKDANQIYDSISVKDIAYYPAQLKKARNLVKQENYEAAEELLKKLSRKFDDLQTYMELGDVLRLNNRYKEAIKFYDKAIAKTDNPVNLWVLYYAKGVAQERLGDWEDAEKTLMKAYNIKKHYLVLNYIGYSWIRQNKNIDEAFSMIVDAYNQAPFDPSINDSLGFALYNLGYYTMALPYLERAAELYPSSAVISSHLGDAYWFAHRKNEAKFQWQHALKLKDDSGELDIDTTKTKIAKGLKNEPSLTYNKEKIEETIKKIKR